MTEASVPLFAWPTPTLGRRIPKEKFYEHSADARKLKDGFVREVGRVTWAHRLDSGSVKLDATEAVPEILILEVEAKDEEDVSTEVLTAIDKAIPHPIVFEISRNKGEEAEIRMAAVLCASGPRSKERRVYSTPWVEAASDRQGLPAAVTLEILYLRVLAEIVQIPTQVGELLGEYEGRVADIERYTRERELLDRRIRGEKQFKRRVELNRKKKIIEARLDNLLGSQTSR